MTDRKIKIAPSILSADFAAMGMAIEKMEACGADMIHCDVMDGMFVPNISFGPKMIADIRKHTCLTLDTHLMVQNPERYVQNFIDAGSDLITIHMEATDKIVETLDLIKKQKVRCGVVINPATPSEVLKDVVALCDLILLMSVNPGFGGQKYIESVSPKINEVRAMIDSINPMCDLEIDGGITFDNVANAKSRGANVIVAGSTIFNAPDPADAIRKLREI